jgi:acetyl coenzyme A synthetase (ADP forming)-like protein
VTEGHVFHMENSVTDIQSIESFERDVLLRDGTMLRLRVAHLDDRDALISMFSRCSQQTVRYRFLHLVKELPSSLLDHLTAAPDSGNLALVVIQGMPPDDRIVAVGAYSAAEERPDVAEVSFLVEDGWQKRGIGTILLDTLAEQARDQGIARFSADVMADNRLMISVFRKAGYGVSATTHYGVTEVEFPIAHNEVADARADAQEAEAERASLRYVFEPRSVAVVGASRDPGSVGGALFRNLIGSGMNGSVYPVNTAASSVAGVHAYQRIADLPDVPELVFITVPAAAVAEVAKQCAAAGVRAICVLSAGFAEMGPEGANSQQELLEICRGAGMRLVGPNCMGLVNTSPEAKMLGTFAPARPPHGNVAMSSQSGALGLALLDQARELGLGVSSFVSFGNKADVSGNDLLQYWEADDATDVILLYMESFGNPRKFARIARRVSRHKPIVAVKSGRTAAGARAARSHTAALASSDRAASALFAQAGIIRVDTLSDFFFVARLLASQPAPAGRRLGILTNAGGPGILAVDASEAAGLQVQPLSPDTQARLRNALAPTASVVGPVDMGAGANPDRYKQCLEILCDDPDLDALLVIFIPPIITPSAEVARVIGEVLSARPALQKAIAAVFLDASSGVRSISAGDRSVPVYAFPEAAVVALGAAARYGSWRAEPAGRIVDVTVDRHAINAVLKDQPGGWLTQDKVVAVLSAASIEVTPSKVARSARDAEAAALELGVPVALKVSEPQVLHKADVGGVILSVEPKDAAHAYGKLSAQLADHGLKIEAATVTPMARPGVEVIAGITHDQVFGPLVAFGLGGYLVELLDDIAFRVLPLTDRDAAAMIRSTRAGRLLQGYRGSPRSDIAAVEKLLLHLAALADVVPRISEIDLNPVIVHPDGRGVTLVDARIRVSEG